MTAAEALSARARAETLDLRRKAEERKATSGAAYTADVGRRAAQSGYDEAADMLFGKLKAGSPDAKAAAAGVARDLPRATPVDERTEDERAEAAANYTDDVAGRVAGERPDVAKALRAKAADLRGGL
jgi:hypothetical protein